MRAIISARLLNSKDSNPGPAPFDIRCTRLKGFLLRIQPSGYRSYYCETGRGRRTLIGPVGHLTPEEAHERCQKMLGNVAHGRHILYGIAGTNTLTLGAFLGLDADDPEGKTYKVWLKANRPKSADRTLQRIRTCFKSWFTLPLEQVNAELIEGWRIERLAAGRSPHTILRDIMTLSGVLSRAVKLGKLGKNPVRDVDKPKIDRLPKPRYLSIAEETRLRDAMVERDAEMQTARESANQWREERHHDAMPALKHFGDHLSPAVLVSINTGLRRGELLALQWTDIDFKGKQLTVEGSNAKSSQTRHVPLNVEALSALERWREQNSDEDRVFAIDSGFKTSWAKLLTRAKITKFRWHDLRHHFASRLAQAGIPLNTIRDLLGHRSLEMTLRYAHLSPNEKSAAVEKLSEMRV